MRLPLHQAPVALAVLAGLAATLPARAFAAPATTAATAVATPRRAQLAAECDQLLRAAVKTPYGWGWSAGAIAAAPDPSAAPPRAPRAARVARSATIDTGTTAAAGLALHLAGKRLGKAEYSAAAVQAARVLSAVQANTGQVPAAGVIRTSAGGNDPPAAVPSRAATCSSLALLLTLLRDAELSPPAPGDAESDAARVRSLRPAALKAANWLATQQTKRGGWPLEYLPTPSPGAPGSPGAAARTARPLRLIRLDRPDARDATFCLWLSASVLRDAGLRRHAELADEELSVLRIADEKSGARNLWAAAYDLDEAPVKTIADLPYGVDAAATDYAMQALLAASLLGDGDAAAPVVKEAVTALSGLPKRDGKWLRYYAPFPEVAANAPGEAAEIQDPVGPVGPAPDSPPGSQVFNPDPADPDEPTAPLSLPQTIAAAGRLADLGPEKYAEALARAVPVEHRLAMAICGLDENALTSEPPTDAAGVRQYLERYQGEFRLLESPVPDDVFTRVRRLGLLLRRVQLEPAGDRTGVKP
jgi:hypothetical protein